MRDEPIYFAPQRKLGGGWICYKDGTTNPQNPQSQNQQQPIGDIWAGTYAMPQQQQQQQAAPTPAPAASTPNYFDTAPTAAPQQQGITTGNINTLTANQIAPTGNMSITDAYQKYSGRTGEQAGMDWWNQQTGGTGQLTPDQQRMFAAAAGSQEPAAAGSQRATDIYNTLVDTTPYAQTYKGVAAPTTVDNQMPQSYYGQADNLLSYTDQAVQKALDYSKAMAFAQAKSNGGSRFDETTVKGFDNVPDYNVLQGWQNSADYKALTGTDRNAKIEAAQRLLGLNRTNDYGLAGFRASDNVDLNSILMPGTPEYEAKARRDGDMSSAAQAGINGEPYNGPYMDAYNQGRMQGQALLAMQGGNNTTSATNINSTGRPQSGYSGGYSGGYGYGQGGGNLNGSIQTSFSPPPPLVSGDKLRDAQLQQQDAAYNMQKGYLDPMWDNQLHDLQTQLINQGIMQNSDAWNRSIDEYNRNKTFAYNQALNNSVQLGNNANQMLFGQGLATNQNDFNQKLAMAQLNNSGQAQGFNQGLAYDQNTFNQGLQSAYLNNASSQQAFNQSMAQRQQGLNELLMQQQNPLSVLNALRGGTNATTPTFGNVPGTNMAGTDYAGLINGAYGQQMGQYSAGVAANNSMMNGLFGLGSSALNAGGGNWLFNALGGSGTAAAAAAAMTPAAIAGAGGALGGIGLLGIL